MLIMTFGDIFPVRHEPGLVHAALHALSALLFLKINGACLRAGGNIARHPLGDYLRSVLAVLLVQFSRKRFPGGMDGAVQLVERCAPLRVRAPHLSRLTPACLPPRPQPALQKRISPKERWHI